MDEQTGFAPRSVLGRRRAGRSRLAIVVPALALVATVWAGLSGARPDAGVANAPASAALAVPGTDVAAPSSAATPVPRDPTYPAEVIGLEVQPLDGIRVRRLGRDTPVAVAGWYVATSITDCPPLAAIYREGSLPEIRGDADVWAFCDRSGVLYASRPELGERNAGLKSVAVSLVLGVLVPPELEMVGATATPVVVVGRFVETTEGCPVAAACLHELVVDHLAWANGL